MLQPAASRAETLSGIEAEGVSYPAPASPSELPAYSATNPPAQGGPDRACVAVTKEGMSWSGEFLIGGNLPNVRTNRMTKIWWKPLEEVPGMSLQVRALLLDASHDTLRSRTDYSTPPSGAGVEHTFFPWGTIFPVPGEWVLVGTSNYNWGCFIISVDAAQAPGD